MDCKQIIKKYLKENGYDGLCYIQKQYVRKVGGVVLRSNELVADAYEREWRCGCSIEHLAMCGETIDECKAAKLRPRENKAGVVYADQPCGENFELLP